MELQPMDLWSWIALFALPPYLGFAAFCWRRAVRFADRFSTDDAFVFYWCVIAPMLLLFFAGVAFNAVRIATRFSDYEFCVTNEHAYGGPNMWCPQWTVDAYRARASSR